MVLNYKNDNNIKIFKMILIFFLFISILGEFNLTMLFGKVFSNIFKYLFGYVRFYIYIIVILFLIDKNDDVNNFILNLYFYIIFIFLILLFGCFIDEFYLKKNLLEYLSYILIDKFYLPSGIIGGILFYIFFWLIGYIGIILFLFFIIFLIFSNEILKLKYFIPINKKINFLNNKFKEFFINKIKKEDNGSNLKYDELKKTNENKNLEIKTNHDKKKDNTIKKINFKSDNDRYILPSINLLNKQKNNNKINKIDNEEKKLLEHTLKSFNVNADISDTIIGPTITQYKLKLGKGIKVNKITSLSSEIAMALASKSIRIQAPIPGEAALGIEIPNKKQKIITLHEILASCNNNNYDLLLPLGKSINGTNIIIDLTTMPHLLVAGSTGSGKSVCLNIFLISLLLNYSPDDLKFLLIDPKKVEFTAYNDIPHLLTSVVTDPKKAYIALKKIVTIMEERYEKFSSIKVKDLKRYNKYCEKNNISKMPYLVIIIDELADLMLLASKNVEECIMRITQMARAAGIHIILATQRPSVDVITGIIKSNIPARIAFSVSSQIDSRTILDMTGAEKLIGNGDLLFCNPSISVPIRIQGPYITDEEINTVIEYIKGQDYKSYKEDINLDLEKEDIEKNNVYDKKDDEIDELYNEILNFVKNQEIMSVSKIQRKYKIGFNRASRIFDELVDKGILGDYKGTRGRIVLHKNKN